MTDAQIERTAPADLTDLPADFWKDAELILPVPKQAISLRVDEDVLDWFRSLGPRYQTRMNAVLRSYMTQATKRSHPRVRRSRKGAA
ncbi:MAG: BrnA antitoxin family protein [Gemmatimonadales bacterium]